MQQNGYTPIIVIVHKLYFNSNIDDVYNVYKDPIFRGNDKRKWVRWHDNRFEVNWHPKPTLVLHWISMSFLFGALPIDTLKIKHTKKLKEIPSRDALENLPEKACMNALIHLKLIGNLQGFCQYIMADMLNFTIANYRKYSGLAFLGP